MNTATMDSRRDLPAAPDTGDLTPSVPVATLAEPEPQWAPYSFERSTLNGAVLRALHSECRDLAGAMARACSAILSNPIGQFVVDFSQTSWKNFSANTEGPSLYISFRLEPLDGLFVLCWPMGFAMSLVELMLGGAGAPEESQRAPTAIDLRLLEGLFQRALAEVPTMFAPYSHVSVRDVRLDMDLNFVPGMSSFGSVLVLSMSTALAGYEHRTVLTIPVSAVQPFVDRILMRDLAPVDAPHTEARLRNAMLDVMLEVRVAYPTLAVAMEDLAHLQPGDVLTLGAEQTDPLVLTCDDLEIGQVVPLLGGEVLSVQMTTDRLEGNAQ